MAGDFSDRQLKLISPQEIHPNPENPRLIFRQDEMESLMLSIDKHGIQVPLTVYKSAEKYYLLDGERRWRCAKKLNLKSVPTIVQKAPSELENLVLMYNIHALREQWDYYTIASKLERVIKLYFEENSLAPTESVLSELTGLTRGAIRRCQLLIDLPDRFKVMLVKELEKPKSQQKLSEDLFIEMEKSLKTVTRRIDGYETQVDDIRDVLISKYKAGIITAVTDFRQLSKIATAVEGLGIAQKTAKNALDDIFNPNRRVGIKEAYSEAVEFEYGEKRASRYITSLSDFLDSIDDDNKRGELDESLIKELSNLFIRLKQFLKA